MATATVKSKPIKADPGLTNDLAEDLERLKLSSSRIPVPKGTVKVEAKGSEDVWPTPEPPKPLKETSTKPKPKPKPKADADANDEAIIVDTPSGIADLVDSMANHPNTPPSFYLDLEGVNLSRHGSISILQIYHLPLNQVYLVDVHKMGKTAFDTPGAVEGSSTLKSILEDHSIQKVFFDVRNDSDALYAHFNIHLAGIQDIQLHEFVTRPGRRGRFVSGIGKCIDYDAGLSFIERTHRAAVKDKGKRLFAPELGGSYEVFNARPMHADIVRYCAQDVWVLPRLWATYDRRGMGASVMRKVKDAVRERIDVCFEIGYTVKGRERALAPVKLSGSGFVDYDEFW
ncbi:ribonuclease H-like domain-containing protein [Aspergillus venezuelensis]